MPDDTSRTTIDEVASRRVDNLLTAIMRIRRVGNPRAQELAREAIAKDNAIASSVATNDPGIDDNSPVVKHELRNLMVAIDESPWHQHDVTGERVKRICLTETAIARIRAAIGDTSHDG